MKIIGFAGPAGVGKNTAALAPASYTHPTLPTINTVALPGVA